MKLITKDDMENQPWRGRGGSSKVFREIVNLQKGQILFIEPEDWGARKYPPTRMSSRIAKKYGYKFRQGRTPDKSGWAIGRVK